MSEPVINPALALADRWQRDFPLHKRPFAILGAQSELSEGETLEMMQALADQNVLARIGAAVRPNTAGASTLAAIAVPKEQLLEVAELVNTHPSVNHNYERDHDINLWFVVTAANRATVTATLNDISTHTGLEVLDLPLECAYHIDLGFPLTGKRQHNIEPSPAKIGSIDHADIHLLQELEDGLDLVPQPYARIAARLGWSEDDVLERLASLAERGVISRFGCILRHRSLGYVANAMAVWDVPDDIVDEIANRLAARREVTLCYRRKRRPPYWRYNLFAMVHGHQRRTVARQINRAAAETGLSEFAFSILFSNRCFKQRGARLATKVRGAA